MFEKKTLLVRGRALSYVQRGTGAAVVFLHGNPTSSFLWRHSIAGLAHRYRCLAPDLIGMGDSDKLPESGPSAYGFATHRAFLDAWFDAVLPREPVVLVVHDWGSALGFDWARRHPDRVRGIAYTEAILGSMPYSALPPPAADFFRRLRSAEGEKMVLEDNVFLERMLGPGGNMVTLPPDVCAEYRRPFLAAGESRRPTLSWPRLLPFDGEPKEICDLAAAYRAWLASSGVPKLFIDVEPGRLLVGALREACRAFPNQTTVTVHGFHYPQEDSPAEVTAAIGSWLEKILVTNATAERTIAP